MHGHYENITKGSFFLTGPSPLPSVVRCVPWEAGAPMREKPGSLFQPRCREVSAMQGAVSSGAITQRKKANLSHPLGLAPHCSIPPVFFSSSSQRGSACALVSGIRVSSDAKTPSLTKPPLELVSCSRSVVRCPYLCYRPVSLTPGLFEAECPRWWPRQSSGNSSRS